MGKLSNLVGILSRWIFTISADLPSKHFNQAIHKNIILCFNMPECFICLSVFMLSPECFNMPECVYQFLCCLNVSMTTLNDNMRLCFMGLHLSLADKENITPLIAQIFMYHTAIFYCMHLLTYFDWM
ncbi:hypothetical protein ACJX0J_012281, partial [Zea mays]